MRELPVNCPGTGGMQVFQAQRAFDGVSMGQEVVVTSGEDGTVCFTNLSQQQKLDKLSKALTLDGFIPSIAVVPEQTHLLLINEDDSTLYSYALPPEEIKLHQLVFRSTVPLRQVSCCTNYIGLASEDPQIKLISRKQTENVLSIDGHDQPVRSIAFSANQRYLCSTSDDAVLKVFELTEQPELSAHQVLKLSLEHEDSGRDEMNCCGAWNPVPNTNYDLAIPLRKDTIALYANDGPLGGSWTSSRQLKIPLGTGMSSYLNTLAFSPDGKHLAAAGYAKQIFVWNVESGECVHTGRIDGDHQVLALQWSPSEYTLVAHHTGGKIAIMKDIVARSTGSSLSPQTASSSHGPDAVSASKREQTSGNSGAEREEEPAIEEEDKEPEARVEAIKASFGFGTAKSHELAASSSLNANMATMMPTNTVSSLKTRQEPFQPGFAVDGSVRLLAWTPLGEIESIPGVEENENLVKVEFHDKTRRGFKFNDAYCFNMAYLDEHGAIFASPRRLRNAWESPVANGGDSSDVVASYVFYRPFESWASNSSWHLELHPSEQAEVVSCAKAFCAVATSLDVVRLYLTSGLEFACFRLANRVVTMAARDNLLAVIVQDAFPFLSYQLWRIQFDEDNSSPVQLVSQGNFPLSPPPEEAGVTSSSQPPIREDPTKWSRLEWLGFDDKNLLYAVDSFGIVQILNVQTNAWVPVANLGEDLLLRPEFADEQIELADGTTVLRSEKRNVFVLGIVNDTVLYFALEQDLQYPRLTRKHRPVPSRCALKTCPSFPRAMTRDEMHGGCAAEGDDQQRCNLIWQNAKLDQLASMEIVDDDPSSRLVHEKADFDKTLLVLMKTACASDEPARALDLAKCLRLKKSFGIAQKLASHFGFRQLLNQLYELYSSRYDRGEQEQQELEEQRRAQVALARRNTMSSRTARNHPHRSPQSQAQEDEPERERHTNPEQDDEEDHAAATSKQQHRARESRDTENVEPTSQVARKRVLPQPSNPPKRPQIQFDKAPVNPFAKKSASSSQIDGEAASTSSGNNSSSASTPVKNKKRSAIERLALFQSPPPAGSRPSKRQQT